MTKNVTLKSYTNGITINLNNDAVFQVLKQDLRKSFEDAAEFFKDASVVLQFKGKSLTEDETDEMVSIIQSACKLHIICIVCSDDDHNDYYGRIVENIKIDQQLRQDNCQFYKGTIHENEEFESAGSVIVLGDVKKGGKIIAKGNIIVLGSLFGTAYAGGDGRNRFIVALHMEPEILRIASTKLKKIQKSKFTLKKNKSTQIALLEKENITIKDLEFTEELLRNLIP